MQEAALSVSLNDSASAFANERAQIQEEEITKMAEILTSLTNHYDQLGEATRLCQSGPEAQDQLDITGKIREMDTSVREVTYSRLSIAE